jgi:uncharacterized protein
MSAQPPPAETDPDVLTIAGARVGRGEVRDVALEVSERYTGSPVFIPLRVVRAAEPGRSVFVTAALHGDELNGTGVIRNLIVRGVELLRGTLILVPIANVFGMEAHSRYLPDRRDLNRSFPGGSRGSLASRVASRLFQEIVMRSHFGIDLHTATGGRTNFPHVRADLRVPGLEPLAAAFGCELVMHSSGHRGTLRAAACRAGRPTLLLEAGEALKIEPAAVALGERGVKNFLRHLGMLAGEIELPAYQTTATSSVWVRARRGGLLRYHAVPGSVVDKGEPLATIDNLFTGQSSTMRASRGGIVVALRTLPAVKPGDPVCNIAVPTRSLEDIRGDLARARGTLHREVQEAQMKDLALEPAPRGDT